MKGREYYNDFFNKSTYTFNALNEEEKRRWGQLEQQLEALTVNDTAKEEPLKILDFGCGDGRFFPLLANYGNVFGLDYADEAIERGKLYLKSDQLYAYNLTDTSVQELFGFKFDIIVSTEVVEHIPDDDKHLYFDNLTALLKKKGVVLLTTPNAKVKEHYFSGTRKEYQQPIEDWISKKEILGSFEKRGLDLISYNTFFQDWPLKVYPKTWWNIFFNHLTIPLVRLFKLKKVLAFLLLRMELGLYQIIVAQKK